MHRLILKTLIFTTFFLAVCRIGVSNLISTSGVELGRINEEIVAKRIQNDSFREELFIKSSFAKIASDAAKAGFVDKKENFVLTSPLPVALR